MHLSRLLNGLQTVNAAVHGRTHCILLTRRILLFLFFVAVLVIIFHYTVILQYSPESTALCENVDYRTNFLKPVIMFKTTFFKNPLTRALGVKNCPDRCHFVDDLTSHNLSADLIVYHHRDISKVSTKNLFCRHNPAILFTMESPINTEISSDLFNNFDYVLSYNTGNLKIKRPYDRFLPITVNSPKDAYYTNEQVQNAISLKKKPILVLVSHCSTSSKREVYIDALSNYIPVTVLGSCNDSPCDDECERQAIREHFFYLSFENSVCENYVTEKFWRLKNLIVPIVLSRQVAAQVAPGNSFIAIDDFNSAEELTIFLYRLMENRHHYENYFNWTKHYLKTPAPVSTACELCDALLSDRAAFKKLHPQNTNNVSVVQTWLNSGHCQEDFSMRYLSHASYNQLRIFPLLTTLRWKVLYSIAFISVFMLIMCIVMLLARRIAAQSFKF